MVTNDDEILLFTQIGLTASSAAGSDSASSFSRFCLGSSHGFGFCPAGCFQCDKQSSYPMLSEHTRRRHHRENVTHHLALETIRVAAEKDAAARDFAAQELAAVVADPEVGVVGLEFDLVYEQPALGVDVIEHDEPQEEVADQLDAVAFFEDDLGDFDEASIAERKYDSENDAPPQLNPCI